MRLNGNWLTLSLKPVDLRKLRIRDLAHCLHCGISDDTLTVQHRANRGMGGAGPKSMAHKPSNLILLFSSFNSAIEADQTAQSFAKAMGWKISKFVDPAFEPVYDMAEQTWFYLDDDWHRVVMAPNHDSAT